jgi:hypothetical protein
LLLNIVWSCTEAKTKFSKVAIIDKILTGEGCLNFSVTSNAQHKIATHRPQFAPDMNPKSLRKPFHSIRSSKQVWIKIHLIGTIHLILKSLLINAAKELKRLLLHEKINIYIFMSILFTPRCLVASARAAFVVALTKKFPLYCRSYFVSPWPYDDQQYSYMPLTALLWSHALSALKAQSWALCPFPSY